MIQCSDCFEPLTDEEIHYYESRCDRCEWLDLYRHHAWRHGGEDKELDERYGGPGKYSCAFSGETVTVKQ